MITLPSGSAGVAAPRNGFGPLIDDQYYALVHWIRSVGDPSGQAPRTIGLSSCASGAGVSTVASNLAIAAARSSDRGVLLLDLSATRPGGSNRLGRVADMSLREAMTDTAQVSRCARVSSIANLSLLTVDSADEPQSLNVDSCKVNEFVRALEDDFGFIVVDLPPVDSSLCFVTVGSLSGVLLVMEAERTRSETAARAKQRLIDARASILGVILNKHLQHLPSWLERRL